MCAIDYRTNLLSNVHRNLADPLSSGKAYLVQGSYDYWHYGCDGFNDKGWGCGYRTLQTISSWIINQRNLVEEVPSIRDIQKILVKSQDKEESFIGSRNWIGSFEVCIVLDSLYDVPSKIIHEPSGQGLRHELGTLVRHFELGRAPIMMGGDADCSSKGIFGVFVSPDAVTADAAYLLVVDPHFTGRATMPEQLTNSWVQWRELGDFVNESFYNLCLPQIKLK